MPKKFPPEFKQDVVRVARRGDPTAREVAADFGVSLESVRRWVRQADVDNGVVAGQTDLLHDRVTGWVTQPGWLAWS